MCWPKETKTQRWPAGEGREAGGIGSARWHPTRRVCGHVCEHVWGRVCRHVCGHVWGMCGVMCGVMCVGMRVDM